MAAETTPTGTTGTGTGTTSAGTTGTARDPLATPLLRYRLLAYGVGVLLALLVLVGVPLNYGFGVPQVSATISPVHGLLFLVYLVAAADLARKAGHTTKGVVLMLLAGVIPLLSFWVERRVTHRVRAGQPV